MPIDVITGYGVLCCHQSEKKPERPCGNSRAKSVPGRASPITIRNYLHISAGLLARRWSKFGAEDVTILPATVETIRKAHPNIETLIWPAPHGFNCDHRGAYRKD